MLLNFNVDNFLSFKKGQGFTMEATAVRDKKQYLFTPTNFEWNYRLLKSVVFYGLNSSGKSNLLNALGVMKLGVLYSHTHPGMFNQSVAPFLLQSNSKEEPSRFEVVFFFNGKKYRYNFEILKGVIVYESLHYSEPKIRENSLFVRQNNTLQFNKKWNKENSNVPEALSLNKNFVKDNILFLSLVASFEFTYTSDVTKWFSKIRIIESVDDALFHNYTADKLNDETYKHNILSILKQANLGFEKIKSTVVENAIKDEKYDAGFISFMLENELISKDNYLVHAVHDVVNEQKEKISTTDFNIRKNESSGTRKFFGLIGLMLEAISENEILLIDELDAQFDSSMFERIFTFFNKPDVNIKGAQMIFTSHNPYLLKSKKIRRDQVYIVEKKEGVSLVKRLHGGEINVRADASLENIYNETLPTTEFNLFTSPL